MKKQRFKSKLGTQKPTANSPLSTMSAQPRSLKLCFLGDFISQAPAPENRILTRSWSLIKTVENFERQGQTRQD